jgi:hypothetical protein
MLPATDNEKPVIYVRPTEDFSFLSERNNSLDKSRYVFLMAGMVKISNLRGNLHNSDIASVEAIYQKYLPKHRHLST